MCAWSPVGTGVTAVSFSPEHTCTALSASASEPHVAKATANLLGLARGTMISSGLNPSLSKNAIRLGLLMELWRLPRKIFSGSGLSMLQELKAVQHQNERF